nr:MAG TPA: putative membrane protein [Caudoviricetes sp.]
MKKKKQLKTAWILGIIFGIILLPISLVAAFAAFPFGLIILALNVWIVWYALRCRKEYKTFQISNAELPQPNVTKTINLKEISAKPESLPEIEKKKKIEIPDHIGEYELKYRYSDVPFAVLDGLENTVGGEDLTFLIDGNDVDVYLESKKIGVMQESHRDMVKDFLNRSEPIKAVLSSYDGSSSAKMFLAFYKPPRYTILLRANTPHETVKLAGTANDERQETILFCSAGDVVESDYDEEKERYYAVCSDRIGYFPKKLNDKLENDPEMFISKIDTDDNGNNIVFVDVFD